jgi:hypothetical protein
MTRCGGNGSFQPAGWASAATGKAAIANARMAESISLSAWVVANRKSPGELYQGGQAVALTAPADGAVLRRNYSHELHEPTARRYPLRGLHPKREILCLNRRRRTEETAMTRPKIRKLVLAGSLLMTPILALAQDSSDADNELAKIAMEQMNRQILVTAIVLTVIVVAALLFAVLRDKRRLDLYARFAEKGQEIPRALLPMPPSRMRELRRATWLSSLGIGLGLVLYIATGDLRVSAWCLILLSLALASLINATFFYSDAGFGEQGENGD